MRDSAFRDLEIDENLPFQRKAWRAQRIAFFVLVAVFALAIAGLFGSGPLSRTINEDPATGLGVEFERFVRYGAPNEVRFDLPPSLAQDGKVEVRLSKEWVEAVQIQSIAPEPDTSSAHPEGYIYTFKISDPVRPSSVIIHTVPNHGGMIDGTITVGAGATLEFSQFVYP